MVKKNKKIKIKGAKEHNLKDINLEVPREKITVFTGISGSGKTSLAFDTIFAEGQRRYVESLSSYARQFLTTLDKPDVKEIEGLSPAISIDQKANTSSSRSTVATTTEIYDYLRVIFSRLGVPYCPKCGKKIQKMTTTQIINKIIDFSKEANSTELIEEKERPTELIVFAEVIRGRKGEYYQLLYDFLNAGFREVRVDSELKSLREKIVLDPNKKHTIELVVDKIPATLNFKKKDNRIRVSEAVETALKRGEDSLLVQVKFENNKKTETRFSTKLACPDDNFAYPEIEPRLFSFNSPYGACPECHGLGKEDKHSENPCPVCEGKRLKPEALSIYFKEKNINDIVSMSIKDAYEFFQDIGGNLSEKDKKIAETPLREIENRLKFLNEVGLDYLTLNRKGKTLSGGEAQRIRLASQIGSQLVGTLYILDEPTIGLHKRDNDQLISTLKHLRDLGNTIIIVEHDEDTIFASDYLVDFGPGAGKHGGEVVAQGKMPDILKDKDEQSLTLDYLRKEKEIETESYKRSVDNTKPFLKLRGARENNLKNLNIDIPLSRFSVITGVSGSGKSTLAYETLYKTISNRLNNADHNAGEHDHLHGLEYIDRVVNISQSAMRLNSRSNPATYVGVWGPIRELFASTEEARIRGWKQGRFSFNVPRGRCEKCKGYGKRAIEMHFLPTVYVTCDACKGRRFNQETLEVEYHGKNIYDILQMSVEEAYDFFKDIPWIEEKLKILKEVGLEYLRLGQPSPTLSGGEAQRVKLASELGKKDTHKTLYILDEPTIGLHYSEVGKLIKVLQKLVDRGSTVLAIEHHLDVIRSADWIIDLGPGGGERGGEVVVKGAPQEVARHSESETAKYLREKIQ